MTNTTKPFPVPASSKENDFSPPFVVLADAVLYTMRKCGWWLGISSSGTFWGDENEGTWRKIDKRELFYRLNSLIQDEYDKRSYSSTLLSSKLIKEARRHILRNGIFWHENDLATGQTFNPLPANCVPYRIDEDAGVAS